MNTPKPTSRWPLDRLWTAIWLFGMVVLVVLSDSVGLVFVAIWIVVYAGVIVIVRKMTGER
jgi:Flp pilus assembly protein TadB